MYPRLEIHEAEADQLREALSKRARCTILIYGESGVGKTTLIEGVLQSVDLFRRTLRYEVTRNHCSIKGHLNSLFFRYYSDVGFFRRLFNTRVSVSSVKLSAVMPTSLSFTRGPSGITLSLGGWPDEIKLVLKSGSYRLNGSTPSSFFRRLWALLESQGVRVIWIANAELIPQEELHLLSELCRALPEACYALIEMGGQQGDVEHRRGDIQAQMRNCRCFSKPIKVHNLTLVAAKRFHERVSRTFPLPPFDFSKNSGLPLSILYNISFSRRKYDVNMRIASLAKTKAQRSTLLILTILFGVVQDAETLYEVARDAKIPFDIGHFIQSGLVEHIEFACVALAAVIMAGDEALRRAPTLGAFLPTLRGIGRFMPAALVCVAALLYIAQLLSLPHPQETPEISERLPPPKIHVSNRVFRNQEVVLDDHQYTDCEFYNVTFVYDGLGSVGFTHNIIRGGDFRTNIRRVEQVMLVLYHFGFISVPGLDANGRLIVPDSQRTN
jgi:hypothetical protein